MIHRFLRMTFKGATDVVLGAYGFEMKRAALS
jgi:hypothetical protein